jgi:hypothetical protein
MSYGVVSENESLKMMWHEPFGKEGKIRKVRK